MHVTVRAQMYKSPRKFVAGEDDRDPVGTVTFMHVISLEGEGARFYASEDHTAGSLATLLNTGRPVEVAAVVDLVVYKGKLSAFDLVKLEVVEEKSARAAA